MVANSSQNANINQTIINNMLQASTQRCLIDCENTFNGNTIIIIGGDANINISQECILSGVSCIMQQSLNQEIQNSMESFLDQSSTKQQGFVLDFGNLDENVNLVQYMQNSVTQLMESSCTFSVSQDASYNYFYVEDAGKTNLNISQSGTITNSVCNMDNSAKSTTYNVQTSDVAQTALITTPLGMIMIAIICGMVLSAIVAIVFFITQGVGAVTTAAVKGSGNTPAASSGSKTTTNIDLASVASSLLS